MSVTDAEILTAHLTANKASAVSLLLMSVQNATVLVFVV